MSKFKNRQLGARQRGFTIFEVSIAVAIASVIQLALVPVLLERAARAANQTVVNQVFTIGDIAQLYRDDLGVWPGEIAGGNCAIADAMADMVANGYLIDPILISAWGEPLVTVCTPIRFDVTAENAPTEARARAAADLLHTSSVIDNGGGVFSVTSVFPAGAAPALNDLLYRVAVPGRPELNQMSTDLDMGGNNIANAGDITSLGTVTANDVVAAAAEFDALTVNGATSLCADGVAGCTTALNNDGQFIDRADGNAEYQLADDAGALIISSAGGAGGNLTILGTISAPNQTIVANQGLRWGNDSELINAQGGSIELGAGLGDDGVQNAGVGSPYIDFHFAGLTEDFNVRFQNSGNRVLTISGAGGNLATLITEGDGIFTNNLQAGGTVVGQDIRSDVSNKSMHQASLFSTTASPGDIIPKPTYCATLGLTPQIQCSLAQFAEGPVATPVYQAACGSTDNGASWRVDMVLVTETGIYNAANPPDPAYNKVKVDVRCEGA